MFSATKRNKQAGFSLLEITTSVVLLGALAAAALPKMEALETQAKHNGERYVVAAELRAKEYSHHRP